MNSRPDPPRTIEVSNPTKSLFPDGIEKRRLVDYYERVADVMLPHVRDRPLVLYRCPDGIESDCFYQKEVADYLPEWARRVTVPLRKGGDQTLAVADDRATLAWLANQAVVTFHVWASVATDLERPRRLIVDLDPDGDDFEEVRHAAGCCRRLFESLEMTPWVMTTGSRGLHVVVALDGKADFEQTREFAKAAMSVLARRHPEVLTTEIRKDKRQGRLYLDIARNAYAQTAVAPYSLRALPGAPVAMPLDWDEVTRSDVHAQRWNIDNAFRRLGQRDDAWSGMDGTRASIAAAANRLQELQ